MIFLVHRVDPTRMFGRCLRKLSSFSKSRAYCAWCCELRDFCVSTVYRGGIDRSRFDFLRNEGVFGNA